MTEQTVNVCFFKSIKQLLMRFDIEIVAGSGDAQTIVLTGSFVIFSILLIVFSMVANGYKSLMSRPVRAVCGTCRAKNRFKAALNPTLLMIVSYIAISTLDTRQGNIDRLQTWEVDWLME